MLDIQFIRDNSQLVKEKSRQKGYDIDIEQLLGFDKKRRELQNQIDILRQERNKIADSMKGAKPTTEIIEKGRQVKEQLADLEHKFTAIDQEYSELLKTVPNMPLDSVPIGDSENQNKVIKTVGEKPNFDFTPKNHAQIAEAKGWIDKERATKIAGARFVYTKGDLVRLEFALWQYAMEVLSDETILKQIIKENDLRVSSKPFVPVLPPAVAKKTVFEATGRLNREEQTYKLEDEDLWVNASAEHTISPMYMNEILTEGELPIRYVGYTTPLLS